ncbi:MAG: hypothetical protein U0O24_00760 [Eggerthellaceae bacterium]
MSTASAVLINLCLRLVEDVKGQFRPGTKIRELVELAETHEDFTEQDIEVRTASIIDAFVDYLGKVNLLIG